MTLAPKAAVAVALILALGLPIGAGFLPRAEPLPVAEPAPTAAPAPEQEVPAPDPDPVATPEPEATPEAPAAEPTPEPEEASTLTLAEAVREAFPGAEFYEGTWGDFTPAAEERAGEPGVYAAVVGMVSSSAKTVEFAGGSATITPGAFTAFGETATKLEITVN